MKKFQMRQTENIPGYWLIQEEGNGRYLWKDGSLNLCSSSAHSSVPPEEEGGWFSSKKEARDTLISWGRRNLKQRSICVTKWRDINQLGDINQWCLLNEVESRWFLGRDEKFHRWTTKQERWDTKEEAEEFLTNWEESQMSSSVMIDGEKIILSEETVKELRKGFVKEKFRPGDRFLLGHSKREYILCQIEKGGWILVTEEGSFWSASTTPPTRRDNKGGYITQLPVSSHADWERV